MMDIRFAPLEGLTDTIYRRTHYQHFGGVSKYYIPFISPTQHHVFTPKELRAIGPEHNAGIPTVPQILAKDAEHFLWAADELAKMGYDEVNLNIGCPSGTVSAKGKGAGMLRDLYALDSFLHEVCAKASVAVSVKTRIGFESPDEWPEILSVLCEYPLKEIIIHPRTRTGFYKVGTLYPETFRRAAENKLSLVYNGDLFTVTDCASIQAQYPGIPLMMGRGLVCNPALAREAAGGAPLEKQELRNFHDSLWEAYCQERPLDQAHSRMRELMIYMSCCFEAAHKAAKNVRKSNPNTYEEAIDRLFEHELACPPCFSQQGIGL
ncbi:MAG: tRNA-dihydrouridine synthase family protein [Clostridia bacterium]|nr:tRNA-dihydrouridine synthase family protein [Clostridia bacterium]